MKLPAEQLAQHLERELRPLYVISGDEPLGTMETLDAIRTAARRQGYADRFQSSARENRFGPQIHE